MVLMENIHSTLRGFKTSDKGPRIDFQPKEVKNVPEEFVDRALKNELNLLDGFLETTKKAETIAVPKKKVK
jgi:hypothetical protein